MFRITQDPSSGSDNLYLTEITYNVITYNIHSPLASLQIQDMLPQQYYKEKVHIFNT